MASPTPQLENRLADWHGRLLQAKEAISRIVVGQERLLEDLLTAIFARGHILLKGEVGVGKTLLLRALARLLGGPFARIEGSVDLLPADLLYTPYLDEEGKPRVAPGPLLQGEGALAVFFFNEINRARPQVHALLLRVMAERSVSAFDRLYRFPHLLVFADRNRLEREETFELPAALRDRFAMELEVSPPETFEELRTIFFEPRFHDLDLLLEELPSGLLPYQEIGRLAPVIQRTIRTSKVLERYAVALWRATTDPPSVQVDGVQLRELLLSGISPRGMSHLLRAARVRAWLLGRDFVTAEDLYHLFPKAAGHRLVLAPQFELEREFWIPKVCQAILDQTPFS